MKIRLKLGKFLDAASLIHKLATLLGLKKGSPVDKGLTVAEKAKEIKDIIEGPPEGPP